MKRSTDRRWSPAEDALKKWGVDTRKGVDAGGAETGRK